MSSELTKNVLTTLTYYDVLDYPMTVFEVWKYLTRVNGEEAANEEGVSLLDVSKELEGEALKRFVRKNHGFYFLRGRENLVEQRLERNKIAEKKIKIAKRVAKFLRFVPFVRMVAVTGRLAMKNTEKKSDLDFLVVLKNRRIFTGRLLVTLAVHLLGKRRYGRKIEDRVCLNHFLSKNYLKISLEDIFSSSEYYFILPLFGQKTFRKFKERNSWIKKYKINYFSHESANLKNIPDSFWAKNFRKFGEKILGFDFIEKKLRKWQLQRIAKDPRTHQNGSLIIANDERLVFLPNPQGVVVYEKFRKKLDDLLLWN
jgi:hypothetical protein